MALLDAALLRLAPRLSTGARAPRACWAFAVHVVATSLALAACSPNGDAASGDHGDDRGDGFRDGTDGGALDAAAAEDAGKGASDGGPPASPFCEAPVAEGCIAATVEGVDSLCDGDDDDCDGAIDEGCACTPGAVQRCFAGAPGRRGVGACSDGTQRCNDVGSEFGGEWGPCDGSIEPAAEACNDLDDDCNGCADDLPDCRPVGSCPGPGDPRVPVGRPFSTYRLDGADFFSGTDARAWRWTVRGSPCDRMFQAIPGSDATSESGTLSYRVRGEDARELEIDLTLSGDYEVTLEVTRDDRSTFECTFVVPVRAPGLRVELCWDETGPTADTPVDLDLHLAKIGTTESWETRADCYYRTCTAEPSVDWGYEPSPLEACTGPGARGDFGERCPNPRLDIDNIYESEQYVPENVNLDNPNVGDRFSILVHHYDFEPIEARPLVNVYCGGELRATYGAEPDVIRGLDTRAESWHVAEVEMTGDDRCDVLPLHPEGERRGVLFTDEPLDVLEAERGAPTRAP